MTNYKKKILAIDDDVLMLDVIKIILEDFNYIVNTYSNPIKALKKLKDHTVDLILLDLIMPQKSGVEVLNEIKRLDNLNGVPVVLVSSSEEIKNVAQKHNLNSYIQKPFSVSELHKIVSKEITN